jgi:hypothetical protein
MKKKIMSIFAKRQKYTISKPLNFYLVAILLFSFIMVLAQAKLVAAASCSNVTCSKTMPDGTSIEKWGLSGVSSTNIVLIAENMGLADASISYDIDDGTGVHQMTGSTVTFSTRSMSGVYDISPTTLYGGSNMSISWNKRITSGSGDIPGSIYLKFTNAAKSIQGEEYDLLMKIWGMKYKTTGTRDYGIPIVWGSATMLKFGSFPYDGDEDYSGNHGIKYNVNIKLYKSGTNFGTRIDSTGKSMIWGFDDIDVGDRTNGDHVYDSNHTWAEHVAIPNDQYTAPFYVSSNTKLNISKGGSYTYIYNSVSDIGESGREDVLYRVNPYSFSYTWQGSNCGTTAAPVTGTIYTGRSWVDVGNHFGSNYTSSGVANNSKITIHKNSETVAFWHRIIHNNIGPDTDNEEYYVQVKMNGDNPYYSNTYARQHLSWGNYCLSNAHCAYNSDKNTSKDVYRPNTPYNQPGGNPMTVPVRPGETVSVWQRLWFQMSNVHTDLGALSYPYGGGECSAVSYYKRSTICVHLYRPPATFTGSVAAKVKLDGSNFVDPVNETTTPAGNKVTTSDGSFTVRFTNTITRVKTNNNDNDDAGGTVSTHWYTRMRFDNGIDGPEIPNKRVPAYGAGGAFTNRVTSELVAGASETVIDTSDNHSYTGTLKYGETKVICDDLRYNNVINYALESNVETTNARKCVKVYRDPKPCDINTGVKFGIHNGENLGRIGAVNYSVSGNDNFSYTPNNASSYLNASDHTQRVTVWARPGDSIKFEHGGCAGAQYAINNNSGLSNVTSYNSTGRLRHYTISQLSVRPEDVNANDYLFGEKIPAKSQNSPLKYSSSKTWSSTDTGSAFTVGDNVELIEQSPSNTTNSTYARDTYNNKSYSCLTLNENAPFQSNHYQIAGVKSTNDTSCHAYSKTTVASDVGHIITQRLNWNYLKVVNDSLSSSGRNTKLTAEANVMVPYNYNAQPYISGPNTNVVYRGSSMGVNLKVFVTPRKNGAFGTGDTEQDKALNTYATITKPTKVTAKYYYRHSGSNTEYGSTEIPNTAYSGRLNQNGAFNGNADDSSSLANGGSTVGSFSIPVPDGLEIGDKVCVSLNVTPADSHNKFMQYVAGSGDNYVAVMETGTSSKTAEFCRTVAKLPTMSVEGSNAFAGNTDPNGSGFNTSRFSKRFDDSGISYMFGSWSEYGVYGKVAVTNNHGFASGATFGYQTGNNGNIAINQTRSNSGEVAKSGAAHSSTCVYSTQTFVNANCNSNNVGKAGIGENAARQFRERIEDRFTSGSSPWIRESEYGNDCVTSNYYHTHKCISAKGDYADGAYHKYADYDVYMNNNKDENGEYIRDENGMIHVRIDGDAYFGSATSSNSTKLDMVMNHNFWSDTETFNWTYVYEIKGTFVLDGDIKVGDIRDGGNNYRDDPTMQRLGNVRVPIISVDKLHLTNRVTRIDAIILANEIDTCAYNTFADFVSGNRIKADRSNLNADVCNHTVEFRAPVYTKKLILNRTAGSERGNSTIQRAEIFDMNMATYLWSYNQMSRYSQAVTVEQREGAPRY